MGIMKIALLAASALGSAQMNEDLAKVSSMLSNILDTETATGPFRDEITEWIETAKAAKEARRFLSTAQVKAVLADGKTLQLQSFIRLTEGGVTDTIQQRGKVSDDERYINYGCYCGGGGVGEPVDEIDSLCRNLFFGYQCLKKDHDECDSTRSYEWRVDETGQPKCVSDVGTCEGDVCRLDIGFSNQLYKLKKSWKAPYHANNGFNRLESCKSTDTRTHSSGSISDKTEQSENEGNGAVTVSKTSCCGVGLDRHMFRIDHLECCMDGSTKQIGMC